MLAVKHLRLFFCGRRQLSAGTHNTVSLKAGKCFIVNCITFALAPVCLKIKPQGSKPLARTRTRTGCGGCDRETTWRSCERACAVKVGVSRAVCRQGRRKTYVNPRSFLCVGRCDLL